MLTPKCSGKIQSLIFLRSTNKGLTYHSSHEDQSLTLMHTFTSLKKIFFRPFGPQFGLNISRRAGPPGPSRGSVTVYHPASRAFLSLLKFDNEITYNNFEISLVVFILNITTNHAITYTNKTIIRFGFVISRIIKVEIGVIS